MAGFQLTLHGRFWVTPEAANCPDVSRVVINDSDCDGS